MGSKVSISSIISVCLFLVIVTSASAKTVTLAWDPSPATNIAGYKIYYKAGTSKRPFDGRGASQGRSPIDVGTALVSSITGLPDAQVHSFTVTAYDTSGNESSYSNMVTSPPAVAIPNPVLRDSTQGTYMTIQSIYDSIPSGQAETIMVKAGEQTPEHLYFDRDVTVIVQGGYDDRFTNIHSYTSFYGSLTIAGGPVTVLNMVIK